MILRPILLEYMLPYSTSYEPYKANQEGTESGGNDDVRVGFVPYSTDKLIKNSFHIFLLGRLWYVMPSAEHLECERKTRRKCLSRLDLLNVLNPRKEDVLSPTFWDMMRHRSWRNKIFGFEIAY